MDLVVGLGHRCNTAQHLRRMMIHHGTMPFDWIVSPNRGVAEAIEHNFEGMLQPERLELRSDRVVDGRFGFEYVHDYAIGPDYLASQPKVVARQRQLVERFGRMLASDATVLFVREEDRELLDPDAPRRLVEALASRRPRSSFHLLFLTERDPSIFAGDPNVTLSQVPSDSWNDAWAWNTIFTAIDRRLPIKGYFPALVRGIGSMPPAVARPTQHFISSSRRRVLDLIRKTLYRAAITTAIPFCLSSALVAGRSLSVICLYCAAIAASSSLNPLFTATC